MEEFTKRREIFLKVREKFSSSDYLSEKTLPSPTPLIAGALATAAGLTARMQALADGAADPEEREFFLGQVAELRKSIDAVGDGTVRTAALVFFCTLSGFANAVERYEFERGSPASL